MNKKNYPSGIVRSAKRRLISWFFLSVFGILSVHLTNAQVLLTESFMGDTPPANVIIGDNAKLTGGQEDPSNQGWLRLTTDATFQKGYAYVNQSFPNTSGITVEFEYKTWRSQGFPADGIGVFLFDAKYGPTGPDIFHLGGYGGSLGYAQLFQNQPPITGGYIGLGLDEFGNYSNATEGRNGGAGAQTPNAVALRGPTTSDPTTSNEYIGGTKVSPETIDYPLATATRPTDAQFYRKVRINLYPSGSDYKVDVYWATTLNGPLVPLFSGTLSTPPPNNMKIGFAASTGSAVDFHEIRNLLISTYGDVSVDKFADKTHLNVGDEITYRVDINNNSLVDDATGLSWSDLLLDGNGTALSIPNDFEITNISFDNHGTPGNSEVVAPGTTGNPIGGKVDVKRQSKVTYTITGKLKVFPVGGNIRNRAYVTNPSAAGVTDINLDNDTSEVATQLFIKAISDINQTPRNIAVGGNVLTNDKGNGTKVQSFSYLDENGATQTVLLGGSPQTISDVYGKDESNTLVKAGELVVNPDGTYTFTPAPGYTGTVPFGYTMEDQAGLSDSATLIIKVIPPIPTNPTQANSTHIIAQDDYLTTYVNKTITGDVLNNDSDPNSTDNTHLRIIGATQGSTVLVENISIPLSGVDINGNAVPVAATLTGFSNGSFTLIPTAGFVGTINPVHYVLDNGSNAPSATASDTANVYITVLPNLGNSVTVANDDANSAPTGQTQTGNILVNDSDPDPALTQHVSTAVVSNIAGLPANIDINIGAGPVTIPSVGTIEIGDNGSYVFTPDQNATFHGTIVVSYEACNNGSPVACADASLYLTVMGDEDALPIDLVDFTANRKGTAAVLNWTTASEQNNSGFDAERSTDAQNWISLGFVPSKGVNGNSSGDLNYSFTDKTPANGLNYYRLKQTDLDGNYTYSLIRTLTFDAAKGISVYPNPARNVVNIEGLNGGETIQVYDPTGRIVLRQVNTSGSRLQVSLSNKATGSYIIEIRDASNNRTSYRVIVNK